MAFTILWQRRWNLILDFFLEIYFVLVVEVLR